MRHVTIQAVGYWTSQISPQKVPEFWTTSDLFAVAV